MHCVGIQGLRLSLGLTRVDNVFLSACIMFGFRSEVLPLEPKYKSSLGVLGISTVDVYRGIGERNDVRLVILFNFLCIAK
jgi:hypothetical protein